MNVEDIREMGKTPETANPKQKSQTQNQRGKWEKERRTTEERGGEPGASFLIHKKRCPYRLGGFSMADTKHKTQKFRPGADLKIFLVESPKS